jgi:hypothetical protein
MSKGDPLLKSIQMPAAAVQSAKAKISDAKPMTFMILSPL